jgi:hypothetical protein
MSFDFGRFLLCLGFFGGVVFSSLSPVSSFCSAPLVEGGDFEVFSDGVLKQALMAYIQQSYQEKETRDSVALAFDIVDGSIGARFEDRINDLVVAMKNVKSIRDVLRRLYDLQYAAKTDVEGSKRDFDRVRAVSSVLRALTGISTSIYFIDYFFEKLKPRTDQAIKRDNKKNDEVFGLQDFSLASSLGLVSATTAADIALGFKQERYMNKVKSLESEDGEFNKKSSSLQQELFSKLSAYVQKNFLKAEKEKQQ